MKLLLITCLTLALSSCASTEFEKRIENNFIYQCSLKLISDVDKKISGDDVGKICTAAYQAEKPAESIAQPTMTPEPSATPIVTVTPVPTATPQKSLVDTDEVKPEPTPEE
jgi:hypothetical protein